MQGQIRHLKHHQIDKAKWDQCIGKAINSRVYALSFYLDIVSPRWEALITDDYEFVMPLCYKKTAGINVLIQPPFTQQLGIFGPEIADEPLVKSFLNAIPGLILNYQFNSYNLTLNKLAVKTNLELNLTNAYTEIKANFSQNTKRCLSKSQKSSLTIKNDITSDEFVHFFTSHYQHPISAKEISIIKQLASALQKHKFLSVVACQNPEGELIAAVMFIAYNNRMIYHTAISSTEGYEKMAMFYLVNEIINSNSGSGKILDFEGSELEGIARFFKGFGARNVPYYAIEKKGLINLTRWLIKIKSKINPPTFIMHLW